MAYIIADHPTVILPNSALADHDASGIWTAQPRVELDLFGPPLRVCVPGMGPYGNPGTWLLYYEEILADQSRPSPPYGGPLQGSAWTVDQPWGQGLAARRLGRIIRGGDIDIETGIIIRPLLAGWWTLRFAWIQSDFIMADWPKTVLTERGTQYRIPMLVWAMSLSTARIVVGE